MCLYRITFDSQIVQRLTCSNRVSSIEWITVVSYSYWSQLVLVSCSVLSICTQFVSNRRQRVVVDGATSERIPIVSGVPQGSVLGPFLFILYTSEIFQLVHNRLYAYVDDCTLLAVLLKPADWLAVAASLNRDLVKIQEWCNHWWIILNPNKTKALVVSKSWTVNHPIVRWSCLVFPFALVPTTIFLAWSLTAGSPSKTMFSVLPLVSQRIGILRLVKRVFVDTSVLLRFNYEFVLQILDYSSPVWGLLLKVFFSFSSSRCIQWLGFALISFSCRCVIDVMLLHRVRCTRLMRTPIIVCSVSFHLLLFQWV